MKPGFLPSLFGRALATVRRAPLAVTRRLFARGHSPRAFAPTVVALAALVGTGVFPHHAASQSAPAPATAPQNVTGSQGTGSQAVLAETASRGITAAQVEAVDAVFQEWSDPAGPGAAVAVTRNGRIIYSQGYGSAQLEYRIPVTPTTPFHVASVSKQFTTFAVALLARDGALSWDDEVHRHLPELPDLGHPVTLRQLAQHTSGVRDQWELLIQAGWRIDDVITRDQIVALMMRQRELNFEPGSEYLYSNMGYSLLAEVVERVSGQDFGEFLRERAFLPLGMHRTHVHSDHTRIVPGRAYSYAPTGNGGWRNAVLSYANQGATSLFTTVEDLGRWMAEMETPVVGDAALWAEMAEPARLNGGDTASYGLGLSVGSYRGLTTKGHGGADAGFRTNLLFFPEEGMGVVVLGNASSFNAGRLAREVAEVFLEGRMEPVEEPANDAPANAAGNAEEEEEGPEPLSAQVMAQYEGSFYSPELDVVYRVRVEEGALVVERPRQPEQTLTLVEPDSFRSSQWGMNRVEFVRDEEGAVAQMLVSGGRVRNVRFHRVEPWGF